MAQLFLTSTLSRAKEPFVPADPKRVTMYVCGPTVYNRAHIGNARPAVVFDLLARLLRQLYGEDAVVYARNITDVDDKINAAAAAEGVPISVITDRYEAHYLADMGALGVEPPSIAPHATAHIGEIICLITRLLAAGGAYEAAGHVLFSVPGFPRYGQLSGRDREEMIAGARVEVAPYKKDPADFVLWKPSPPELPGWESPWGRGRPGWHIECSAMIRANLGESIDIHGGGQDLIFPHHENEIAQSECAGPSPLARYWVHNGFLNMGRDKMSKSLGNIVTVEQLLAQGHKGQILRWALLSAHYRQPLEWTEQLIEQSRATLEGFSAALRAAHDVPVDPAGPPAAFLEALCDDLNTPAAMAELQPLRQALTAGGKPARAAKGELIAALDLLGCAGDTGLLGVLTIGADGAVSGKLGDPAIASRVIARAQAKAAKDWAAADAIRAELKAQGILLDDGKDGRVLVRRG